MFRSFQQTMDQLWLPYDRLAVAAIAYAVPFVTEMPERLTAASIVRLHDIVVRNASVAVQLKVTFAPVVLVRLAGELREMLGGEVSAVKITDVLPT